MCVITWNPRSSNFDATLGHFLPQVWSLLAGLTMQCSGPIVVLEQVEALKPLLKQAMVSCLMPNQQAT